MSITVSHEDYYLGEKENIISGEFAEELLADLIAQGLSSAELLEAFKQAQKQIRPAVEALLAEADSAARGESPCYSYQDIFGVAD